MLVVLDFAEAIVILIGTDSLVGASPDSIAD